MKHSILFLFLFFQFISISHAQEIEIKTSRMHGLLIFVYSNAGMRHYSPYIKEFTEKSIYKDEVTAAIGDFSKIEKSLYRGVDYRQEVMGYGDGFSPREILEIQSAYASDVDDLMLRVQRLMPIEDWRELRRIFKACDPIYEKLIWAPYKNDILAAQKLYQNKVNEWKVNQLFAKAEKFYNSSWPTDYKFVVTLYPIPKGSHNSNAHSLSGFESVGIIIGETDTAGRFGVIFHEMMHSLYEAQEFEFKQKLLSYFELDKKDADLAFRKGAQYYSNEIYATLLGNGWFYESVTGAKDTTEWYNDIYINTLAHSMYDLTKNYLANSKSMDQDYVRKFITEFKTNFPKYATDPDYFLQSVELTHSGHFFKSQDIKKALRENYRVNSLSINGNSNLFKEKFHVSKDEDTTFILLSMAEAKKITKKVSAQFGLPTELLKKLKNTKTGVWFWTDKQGHNRILGIADPEKLEELFKSEFLEISK
jgi:hypothetical protein